MGAKVHTQSFDSWVQDRSAFQNHVNMFGENLNVLVEEEGSIFPIQKDEIIRVEELYRCCDLNDDYLGLNDSNQRRHFNFGELLTLEYHPTKTDCDISDSNPNLSDDVEIVEEEESVFPIQKDEVIKVEELYTCCDLNDDVLGLNDPNQRMHYNFGEFLTLEYHPTETNSDIPDSNPSLSDDVEIFCDGIFGPGKALFSQEKSNLSDSYEDYLVGECFSVTDKQWLSLSSQNLSPSNDNQSNVTVPTINHCSKIGGSLFSNVFNFKKKPRCQRVKRKWQANHVSWKELSPKPESSEIEEENVNIALKRLRKQTRWYVKESMEQDFRHRKKKCGASTIGPQKQHQKKINQKNFNGECIQVPFGEPILSEPSKEKMHQPKDSKNGTGPAMLNVDTKVKSVSVESQKDISGDDCIDEKMNNSGRKHNNFWSLSEVESLVEGVSTHGVGRWTHIKKLKFNSSPNRTSIDLKDKWRNLLRASGVLPNKKRKRKAEQRKKHTPKQVPQHILRWVKELADLHPYPRPAQDPQTSCGTS